MMHWLTHNWGIKVVSLALAVGLWYYAVGEEGIEVTRIVPLEIHVENPQMSILKTSARAVQVTFMTPRAVLSDLTAEEIVAVHEIGSEVSKAGDYSFRLEAREIHYKTPQVRIVKLEPDIIQVTLDELIVQKLAIKPAFTGEPAFGYKLIQEEMQLNPNAALVEGPKGQLEKLNEIQTESINLVGRTRSFKQNVSLNLPANVRLLGEPLVDIYIPISEEFEEKEFRDISVKVVRRGEEGEKIAVTPDKVTFILKGSKKQFEKVVPEKLLTYVDLSTLPEGEHEVPVEIVLPERISLKQDKPLTVKAVISKK